MLVVFQNLRWNNNKILMLKTQVTTIKLFAAYITICALRKDVTVIFTFIHLLNIVKLYLSLLSFSFFISKRERDDTIITLPHHPPPETF